MKTLSACILLAILTSPAFAATLTLVSPDRGGRLVVVDDGELSAARGTRSGEYSGWVVVEAFPWRGWRVRQWFNDCKGRANACRLRMSQDRVARIKWERIPIPGPVAKDATGRIIGTVIGHDVEGAVFNATVMTQQGYRANIDLHNGTIDRFPSWAYFEYAGCTGRVFVEDNVPLGMVAVTQEAEGFVYISPTAERLQNQMAQSLFIFGECEDAVGGPFDLGTVYEATFVTTYPELAPTGFGKRIVGPVLVK